MAHTSIEESLAARLDEIDAALLPYQHLIEERKRVEDMLAFYRDRASRNASAPKTGGGRSPSKVNALLGRTREILRGNIQHQMTFRELFELMPAEVLGNARHVREHYRGMLQRAGERFGIEYVDSDCVRLSDGDNTNEVLEDEIPF